MDFLDILQEKAFLGREFLTWLWFTSERTGGRIEVPGRRTIEVIFLDRMVLNLADAESPQSVAIRGEQSELREGLAALREGKKIEEARFSFRSGDDEFSVNLKATWFLHGSLRTPAILPGSESDEEEGPEGRFLEKAALVEEAMDLIDELFGYFLDLRVSPLWEDAELSALRAWVTSGSQ